MTHLFFFFPLLATAGSLAGAAVIFLVGRKIGEAGIERWVPQRIRKTIRERGAVAMAVPALLPPPFPLTPFILTCGALSVSPWRFFITLGVMRLIRFGTLGVLGVVYGGRILATLQSHAFNIAVGMFVILALVGAAYTIYRLAANARRHSSARAG
jgi:uncharacterized membrane protein YdjX (TVP38/TMEM64 family)